MRVKKEYGKVAVLMGGPSAERDVSLRSGNAVLAALKRQGIDAYGIDADANVVRVLQEGKFDRAFIALHGRFGEDGTLQGALETIGMRYTGTGVLGSALGMDKMRSHLLWKAAGLPVPESVVLKPGTDLHAVVKQLGLPLFVKPSHEGSSLGITKVNAAQDMASAYEAAARYDRDVFAERAIVGPEITCGIVAGRVLPPIRIVTQTEFYDYEAKYQRNDTQYLCPAGLSDAVERRVAEIALRAFDVVGGRGWGRTDIMLDEKSNAYVLEVNTVPGMTNTSLIPKAARQSGTEFDDLVLQILETSNEPR